MGEFDPGPPQPFHDLFDHAPDYGPVRQHFWFDWGPVFYRGRLDGTARVLCVASDPGPTERVAGRTLVGDAGQRVQGFLAKLGLTRSYICLNAFSFALFPSHGQAGKAVVADPDMTAWRNQVFDAIKTPNLQVVVAFGAFAEQAVELWPGRAGLTVAKVPHPSSRNATTLLNEWRAKIGQLRAVVTPDPDGDATGPNYGTSFGNADYAPIPRRDLPFGVPPWLGDDAWGRSASPRHNNSVSRPTPDDRHMLIWIAPVT
jgi:uracil-DNA glycosylase